MYWYQDFLSIFPFLMFRNAKLGQGSTANRHPGLLKFGPSEVDERCLARTPLSEHSDNDALADVEAENLLRKGARSSCSADCVVLSAVDRIVTANRHVSLSRLTGRKRAR